MTIQREAEHRLENLIKTVEHLTLSSPVGAPDIRSDLERVRQAQADLEHIN